MLLQGTGFLRQAGDQCAGGSALRPAQQLLELVRCALGFKFHITVVEIAHPAGDADGGCLFLGGGAVIHALHPSADHDPNPFLLIHVTFPAE